MQPIIPLLNQKNAVLLSEQDILEMGFSRAAFCFAELLMKPGLDALLASENPKRLLGIQGGWVADLRAVLYAPNAESFSLVSHYDGSKLSVSLEQMTRLLVHLDVRVLVLPPACTGLFADYEHLDPGHIESNAFVKAHLGQFWDGQTYLDIRDAQYQLDTTTLAKDCHCKACLAPYTKTYLHHLYQETPLLAERYLAMHNLMQSRGS